MIKDLEEAGFDMSFSPILWTYHTGFPKASDTSKMIDKRLGAERKVVGENVLPYKDKNRSPLEDKDGWNNNNMKAVYDITEATTNLAKKYEGSKLGFQPKPAIEHVIVGMKPHGQKSYIDNVLNFEALPDNVKKTYPFIQTPKPPKKEKDLGLTGEEKVIKEHGFKKNTSNGKEYTNPIRKNTHPTVKPVKLMSYLTTLFTREGDYVLDPFMGSGTTGLSSKLLNRNFIGIELEEESFNISTERLSVERDTLINYFKDVLTNEQTKLDI
jgi:site-specific DNA-methyltransferase (adenine-specific)